MPLTGVDYRHACYDIHEMREKSQTFTQKNKTFNEVAIKLSLECVKELDFNPQDVCMITSTTMTGVGIPTVPHTLFKEFALTLAGAVFISGIVALPLSPMM